MITPKRFSTGFSGYSSLLRNNNAGKPAGTFPLAMCLFDHESREDES
jgi:hypothetical protein